MIDTDAINAIAELVAARIAPQPKEEAQMTLDELFAYYLDNYARLHCRTWPEMERLYRTHLSCWGNRSILSLQKREVCELHSAIAATNGKYVANRVIQLLRAIYNRCDRIGLIDCANPARNFEKLKEEPRDRFLEREEIDRFLSAVKDLRYKESRDMLLMLVLTGQRRENVLSMEWSEISFDRGNWHIPGQKMKAGRAHDLPLHPEALKILKGRFAEIDRSARWVFPAHKSDAATSRRNLWRAWKECVDKAGLKDVRIHDLRRTLASWQVITGTDIRVVAATLSHRDLKSTMIYARLNTEPIRKSIATAGAAMFGTTDISQISGTSDNAGNAFGHAATVTRLFLSDDFAQSVEPSQSKTFLDFYDSEVRQLCLRVRKTGGKAWIVFGYLNKQPKFYTLGHPAYMTVDKARERALAALRAFAQGVHPKEAMTR